MAQPDRGVLAIAAIALATAATAAGLQQLMLQRRPPLERTSGATLLRRSARFDPDPQRRRLARLILAAQPQASAARRHWLLQGQAWNPANHEQLLVPVLLKAQALAARQLGLQQEANARFEALLRHHPLAPPSADALYYLGRSGGPKHQLLLQRFPAHPAALAAAVDWHRQEGGAKGGLHLARWGERWPGAQAALLEACFRPEEALSAQQRDRLAGALAQQGDLKAAQECLGEQPAVSDRTRRRLGLDEASAQEQPQPAWEVIRKALLQRQWSEADRLLERQLQQPEPAPIAARHRFWRGMVAQEQGDAAEARALWQELLERHPFGYYGWRASERLGQQPRPLPPTEPPVGGLLPPAIGKLSALGLDTEAWEHWRTWRGGRAPDDASELWQEGQLRLAVGDRWSGLDQLDAAQRQGAAQTLAEQHLLEQGRHPLNYGELIAASAAANGLEPELLQGLARQESRLTPTVKSAAGAVGLLQLLPSTAAELEEPAPDEQALKDPARSAALGAAYLAQMLELSDGNLYRALAAYNAGPGASTPWVSDDLQTLPELWVEAIPFPETRLYVKKVLGNRWSYKLLAGPPARN